MIITCDSDQFSNARLAFNDCFKERLDESMDARACVEWLSDIEIKYRVEKTRSAYVKVKTKIHFHLNLKPLFIKCFYNE